MLRVRVDLGAMAIKDYLALPSDCLVSYLGHSLGDSTEMQSMYSTAPTDWATGHLLRKSYPSAVYSTAPVDWANEQMVYAQP